MKAKLSIIGAAAAVPMVIASLAGAAANLVANGTFDNDISGWAINPGQAVTLSHEAGHLKIVHYAAVNYETWGIAKQCVTGIDSGATYRLEADAFEASGQAVDGSAKVAVLWHSTADCSYSGPTEIMGISFPSTTKDAWQHVTLEAPAAAGAQSADVIVMGVKQGTGQHTVLFDNVLFQKEVATPLHPPGPVPTIPEFPQGPFDIVVPGPVGHAPEAQPPVAEEPKADEPDPGKTDHTDPPLPVATPTTNPQPGDQPGTSKVEAEAPAVAPLPPSAGTGLAPQDASSIPLTAVAALLALMGAVATAWTARAHS